MTDTSSQTMDRPGLLLVNLGTPDQPNRASVRRYLREFLSDRRVVELPAIVWQPILRGVILNSRPAATAANYQKIWTKLGDDSPLRLITRQQAEAMQAHFGDRVQVGWAMRYGNPGLKAGLDALLQAGCTRIVVAPLYPQYASATTGTVLAAVFRHLQDKRHLPALRTLPPYFDHPAYIEALRQSVEQARSHLPFAPERILLSFHGLPQAAVDAGDPYAEQCQRTAKLLRRACGMDKTIMPVCYQSRFGPAKWLQPYLLPMVQELAQAGVRRIAVMAPGFSTDCIETLEEVDMQVREAFIAAGGTDFAAIPCLNASEAGLAMLQTLCTEQLAGWTR